MMDLFAKMVNNFQPWTSQKKKNVCRYNDGQDISSKIVHYGISSISIFEQFFASIDKIFIFFRNARHFAIV